MGFLFLGSGQYALKTSNLESIAYLVITAIPSYVHKCPLQETKHFWSMAVEPRCLVIRDATTEELVDNVPFEVNFRVNDTFDETKFMTAPCLLPDIRKITSLKVNSEGYYPIEIKFDNDLKAANFFKNGTVLHIQPKKNSTASGQASSSSYENTSDIQRTLKMKVDALESDKVSTGRNSSIETLAHQLNCSINLNDTTMAELKTITRDTSLQESSIYSYDFDMLCSDANNGDVNDYQLEIWRSKQNV